MAAAFKMIFGVSAMAVTCGMLGCAPQHTGEVRHVEEREPVAKKSRVVEPSVAPSQVFSDATLKSADMTVTFLPSGYMIVTHGTVISQSRNGFKSEEVAYEVGAGQLTFAGGKRVRASDQPRQESEVGPESEPRVVATSPTSKASSVRRARREAMIAVFDKSKPLEFDPEMMLPYSSNSSFKHLNLSLVTTDKVWDWSPLGEFTHLDTLVIDYASGEGIETLLSAVSKLTNLNSLAISNIAGLVPAAAKGLDASGTESRGSDESENHSPILQLKALNKLVHLDLTGSTHILESDLRLLQNALPNCIIIGTDGNPIARPTDTGRKIENNHPVENSK